MMKFEGSKQIWSRRTNEQWGVSRAPVGAKNVGYIPSEEPGIDNIEMQLGAKIVSIPASYRLTDVTDVSALLWANVSWR